VRAGLEEVDCRREHNREEQGDREQGEDFPESDDQLPKEERGTDHRDADSPESGVAPQRNAGRSVVHGPLRFDAPLMPNRADRQPPHCPDVMSQDVGD
jgi:hypothetical protein